MKSFSCHKVVKAGRLTEIEVSAQSDAVCLIVEAGGVLLERLHTDRKWLTKHTPHIGGYVVEYVDGYRSFSPARAFESGYRPIHDAELEQLRVTPESIEALVVKEDYSLHGAYTVCVLTLRNGFCVHGGNGCVHVANFDAELGRKYARENALEKVWELEGYRLRELAHQAEQNAEPLITES